MRELGPEDIRALEAQIEADPDDLSPYRVYSDWLQSQGDPRGELIAIQAELARLRELEQASAALLRDHRAHFLGPLVQCPSDAGSPITATWKLGFIDNLSASLFVDAMTEAEFADLLARVLAHASARFIRGVYVFCGYPTDLTPVVATLAGGRRSASLRALHLGEPDLMMTKRPGALPALGDVEPLLAGCPRLRDVVLNGRARLGRIRLPGATRFALAGCDADSVTSLVEAEWPHLEELELAFVKSDAWTLPRLDALTGLLTPARLPHLRSLHLCGFAPDVSGQVVTSDLMGQLTSLTLTQGSADSRVVELLADRLSSPGALQSLDLSANRLAPDQVQRLRALPVKLTVSDPALEALPSRGSHQFHCSFCGLAQNEVRRLISGPRVFICDECVALCREILDQQDE